MNECQDLPSYSARLDTSLDLFCVWHRSNLKPEVEYTLEVFDNFRAAQLAVAVDTIHKCDRTFLDLIAHSLGPDHHFHLEAVTLRLSAGDDLFKHLLLVQTKTTSQVANTRHEHDIGNQVGGTRGKLAEEIPTVNPTLDVSTIGVAGTSHDICVGLLLNANHLRDKLGVMAEVGIHNDHIVARAVN